MTLHGGTFSEDPVAPPIKTARRSRWILISSLALASALIAAIILATTISNSQRHHESLWNEGVLQDTLSVAAEDRLDALFIVAENALDGAEERAEQGGLAGRDLSTAIETLERITQQAKDARDALIPYATLESASTYVVHEERIVANREVLEAADYWSEQLSMAIIQVLVADVELNN